MGQPNSKIVGNSGCDVNRSFIIILMRVLFGEFRSISDCLTFKHLTRNGIIIFLYGDWQNCWELSEFWELWRLKNCPELWLLLNQWAQSSHPTLLPTVSNLQLSCPMIPFTTSWTRSVSGLRNDDTFTLPDQRTSGVDMRSICFWSSSTSMARTFRSSAYEWKRLETK